MFYLIPVTGYDEYEIDDFGQACVLENNLTSDFMP